MEKKNPFVMTIGFDKTNPRHVQVAELLNRISRKKAQYIVDAVLCYQDRKQSGTDGVGVMPDYENIRRMVLEILQEQKENRQEKTDMDGGGADIGLPGFDDETLSSIFSSIEAFRQ